MRLLGAALTVCGMAFLAVPSQAQQIVETSTGKHVAGGNCAVSEAMLTAIQDGEAAGKAETRTRLKRISQCCIGPFEARPDGAVPLGVSPASGQLAHPTISI